jgi:FkbM family methyltransferase
VKVVESMIVPDRVIRIARNMRAAARGAVALARGVRQPFGCDPLDLQCPWELRFNSTANELDVLYCFRLILGRLPGRPEWPGHRGLAGRQLNDVVASYLSSKEFADRELLQPDTLDRALVEFDGYVMYVPPHDIEVGQHIFATGIYEPDVTAAISSCLKPGMAFIDIGANIGYFALMAAHLVGNTGLVFAFEPSQTNVRFIAASARQNRYHHLRVYPFALADVDALLAYNSMGSNGVIDRLANAEQAFRAQNLVYGTRLDSLLGTIDRIDVVKIDVEGAEYLALKGAHETLQRHRPLIFSEFSPYALENVSGVSGPDYLRHLTEDLSYSVSVLAPGGTLLDRGDDVDGIMADFESTGTDHIDLVARPNS